MSHTAVPSSLKHTVLSARAVLRAMRDSALPPPCAVCSQPVAGRFLCPAGRSKLSFISRAHCERFDMPIVYDPGIRPMAAIANPAAYNGARRRALR